MAGEVWQEVFHIGKETTPGTPVPATRILYGTGALTRDRAVNLIEVSTGTRDMQRDAHLRAVTAGGTFNQPLSADEMVELLLACLKGGVTPTTVSSPTPGAGSQVTPTTSGTGGTIPAGVYTVVITQTTAAGESQGLTITATVTTTGSTSTITVPSVAGGLVGAGLTAVNYYLSTPGGGAATATFAGTNASGASITLTAPGNGTQHPPATTPASVNTWVFTLGTTLDAQTWEWFDGYNAWQETGVYIDQLKITGTTAADNTVACTLFGQERVTNALTGSLTARTPDFIEGWEAKLYIDPFGGTPGTTVMPHEMVAWDMTIANNLGRKYFADNTKATGAVTIGKLALTADLTLEGASAAMAEYANWDNGVKRLVRLEFGNNEVIGTGTAKKKVMVDMPCVITAVDVTPEDAGTKVFKFSIAYITDTTNGFPIQVTLVNGRSSAY